VRSPATYTCRALSHPRPAWGERVGVRGTLDGLRSRIVPLTRRCAPTSPRKRGEVESSRSTRSNSRLNFQTATALTVIASFVGWAKARLRRAHHFCRRCLVGTLPPSLFELRRTCRFAHPTASLLVMTTKHTSAFPRGDAPGACMNFRPMKNRGRREYRALDAPAASRAKKTKHTSVVTTGSPGTPGIPCAMVYGLLRALPGDRAFLSPSLAEIGFRQLDASVGASGPHDFAVRKSAPSSLAPPASTASRPNVRDDGQRPSPGTGRRES
jgi:hypothetical protein